MEEGGNQSENNDDLPEEEDIEVLPIELEEPPTFVANESADEIENILEEDKTFKDTEDIDYRKKKGNKRKTHVRVAKETMSDDERNKNDKEKTYVMESGHNETIKKMSRINVSLRIKPVEDQPMSEV